jgi:DNA-binding NtrC family response regulator
MAKRPGPGAGRWKLHSTQVHGSTSYNRREAKKEAEEEIDEALRQHTVLVAEDDAQARENIVGALRDRGYIVLTADNGDEAEATCKYQKNIDLLVTGVTLPGLDGLLLTGKVSKRIPVVVYTTHPEEYANKAKRYGACAVVGKSFAAGNSEELCDVVDKALR